MRKIYSLAQQVIVWLGPTADGSDDVMDGHAHVAQVYREHLRGIGLANSIETESGNFEDRIEEERMFLADDENWSSPYFRRVIDDVVMTYAPLIRDHRLQKWLSRVWFSRIWIIQELSLARDTVFVCGDR
ncbi:hypothetical protein SMAC4_14067 [Sordaria macrospora]|uniref:uncharacterized protein n=1 Tax=Sordaria macrospora TaxID=5147 RepID=UPI002B2F657D|nr:hypothetical protein SMAC4_14067 [Sordaria macrospora]